MAMIFTVTRNMSLLLYSYNKSQQDAQFLKFIW